mgnify:CR=1 FL=1
MKKFFVTFIFCVVSVLSFANTPTYFVKNIDTENMQLIGYEGSSYTLYEDDGIHKDYDKKENYRVLTK